MSKKAVAFLPQFNTVRGVPTPTLANISTILTCDPRWTGVLAWDDWAGRVRAMRPPPRHATDGQGPNPQPKEFWGDHHTDRAIVWCEQVHKISPSKDIMARAIEGAARGNVYHTIKEYLSEIVWDKSPRLDEWLVRYVRVPDSPYARAVGRMWMISAVARVFDPGCQVDYVLILEGPTRGGKSSVLRALCNDPEWFLETGVELGTKDAYQMIRAKWIVELAELDSLSRSESSRVKAFITCRKDTYRRSYGREVTDVARGCVFAGTTNDEEYLKDETGGARWWPVYVNATQENRIDIAALGRDRDQLWAEAVDRYQKGEKWHPESTDLIGQMRTEQEARRRRDPWEDIVETILSRPSAQKKGVTIKRLLDSVLPRGQHTIADSMRVARCLTALNWAVDRTGTDSKGNRVKIYRPRVTP